MVVPMRRRFSVQGEGSRHKRAWPRKIFQAPLPFGTASPSLCSRADLKALSGGQDQLHRLTSLLAHRGGITKAKPTGWIFPFSRCRHA